MNKNLSLPIVQFVTISLFLTLVACSTRNDAPCVMTVKGPVTPEVNSLWLSHEHILVDFIGADSIHMNRWDIDTVKSMMMPLLTDLSAHGVGYFVDATPAFLGRDPMLLKELSQSTGIHVLTTTGYYGARKNKFIPDFVRDISSGELADIWIKEFNVGIDSSDIRPGFIKIGIDAAERLDPIHEKLVAAAALTHRQTGLTIASHTGPAVGLWPQLDILESHGVHPSAFIWVHAQNETDSTEYSVAAMRGCWISLDGMGWEQEEHIEKLVFARNHGILNRILISHDAGWFDPAKKEQDIVRYTAIFLNVLPKLRLLGFTNEELTQLLVHNPVEAFGIRKRLKGSSLD